MLRQVKKNFPKPEIRAARPEDAEQMAAIYAPYVQETTVSYDTAPMSAGEFAEKIAHVTERFPWLAAVEEGTIVGYAYASPFRERDAYGWSCELSVYVERSRLGQNIGSALYEALLKVLERMGFVTVYGVIDVPNEASAALHRKFGFRQAGLLRDTGFKHGRWLTAVILEKQLIFPPPAPNPVREDWRSLL